MYYPGPPWDAVVEGGADVPVGGNITAIYDGNDQPTEAQIRDGEGRIVSRFVRTYDANGRILEEKHILENPILLMADKLAERGQPEFNELNAAQLEGMNAVMKLMLGGGRSGTTGITYSCDAQGRVTEMRIRKFGFDRVTTISYNEHGDQTAQRETVTRNSPDPRAVAYEIDRNGTVLPKRRTTEPTESPALPEKNEVLYEYEYYGNWTQQTENPDRPYQVHVRHRKLTNVLLTRGTRSFPPLPASLLRRVSMTQERKYAILFSATILAARKLAEIGDRPCPAREMRMEDAIRNAERILQKIDERWPTD